MQWGGCDITALWQATCWLWIQHTHRMWKCHSVKIILVYRDWSKNLTPNVCWFFHHFGPELNISTSTRWIGRWWITPMTFPSAPCEVYICGLWWNVLMMGWFDFKSSPQDEFLNFSFSLFKTKFMTKYLPNSDISHHPQLYKWWVVTVSLLTH